MGSLKCVPSKRLVGSLLSSFPANTTLQYPAISLDTNCTIIKLLSELHVEFGCSGPCVNVTDCLPKFRIRSDKLCTNSNFTGLLQSNNCITAMLYGMPFNLGALIYGAVLSQYAQYQSLTKLDQLSDHVQGVTSASIKTPSASDNLTSMLGTWKQQGMCLSLTTAFMTGITEYQSSEYIRLNCNGRLNCFQLSCAAVSDCDASPSTLGLNWMVNSISRPGGILLVLSLVLLIAVSYSAQATQ